jgi:hypothetical protein
MKLWFGKHDGKEISELSDEYLAWLLTYNKKDVDQKIRLTEAIEREITFRETRQFAELNVAQQIIEAGYRVLAAKRHPDAGGNHEDMVELNATAEALRRSLEVEKTRA